MVQFMKIRKILVAVGIIILVCLSLLSVISWNSSKKLKEKIETKTGKYITLTTLKDQNEKATAFVLKDSEIDGNMAIGYLDGLSVDVYYDQKSDPEKQISAYMKKYRTLIESLGYEVETSSIRIEKKGGFAVGGVGYSGIMDGKTKHGSYSFYSIQQPGGGVISYILNQPLSQTGEKGREAFKDFVHLLESQD